VDDTCFPVGNVVSDLEANLFGERLCAEFTRQLEVGTVTKTEDGEAFLCRGWQAFGVM
jgi:hypothetical protein